MSAKSLYLALGIAVVAAAAAVVVVRSASEPEPGSSIRSFRFATTADTVVLRVRNSPFGATYQLKGDGTLKPTSSATRRSVTYTPGEMDEILTRLADAGVFDLDQEELQAALRAKPRTFAGSEPYSAHLEIQLEEYSGPDQDGGPLNLRLIVDQPSLLAAHFPERADLRAIVDLLREFNRVTKDGS